jgi:hypothetical protein
LNTPAGSPQHKHGDPWPARFSIHPVVLAVAACIPSSLGVRFIFDPRVHASCGADPEDAGGPSRVACTAISTLPWSARDTGQPRSACCAAWSKAAACAAAMSSSGLVLPLGSPNRDRGGDRQVAQRAAAAAGAPGAPRDGSCPAHFSGSLHRCHRRLLRRSRRLERAPQPGLSALSELPSRR